MTKNKSLSFSSEQAQNLIDSSFNSRYPIIEKRMNSYLMPENMMKDVDYIDSSRFYENSKEYMESLGIEGSSSRFNKKNK